LLEEIVAAMQAAEIYEIIYVDDGSTDHSADILRAAQERISRLRVLRHKRLGLGSAARLLQEAHQPPPRRRAGASGGVG
jgi:dolichol-phosphate mannosyltransferase